MARRTKDNIDRWLSHNVDFDSKTLYLGSSSDLDGDEMGVDHTLSSLAIRGLHSLDVTKPDLPITIILNNPGGDTAHGLAIFDFIKRCKSHVTIQVFGRAASMAAWILQAGDHRQLSKHSYLMIHEGEMWVGGHPENVQREMEQYKKEQKVFEDILLCRMQEVNPTITREDVKRMLVFDTILDAQDAVALGLADEIIGEE